MTKPEATNVEHEVKSVDLIVSKSDAEGNITYVNPIFIKISGYSQASLLEKPHAILRHPDMPKAIFKYLWQNIKEGRDVVAYVKNLCADGGYYWVLATVKMAKNPDGSFRNYMSTRKSITDRAKEQISALYKSFLDIEKDQGEEASWEAFNNFLSQNSIHDIEAFNAFMKSLNK
ncbi:PUTATIVE SIGNAL-TRANSDUCTION SENSOR PROTEIN [hydrothermal vent metagenome]|uniref:PUTATIVE SIGNAL-TRANSDUCTION SENSOR PROTEIN n=1 Tax=hydrothermal vent metagenome TaxID=652676 RepID=A0A1W1BQ71_9ZZZZ